MLKRSPRFVVCASMAAYSFIFCTKLILAQEDDCSRLIPAAGAYQIVLQDGTKTNYSNERQWFCSDAFLKYAHETSESGSISIPTEYGVGSGTFNSSDQEQLDQRTRFCQDNSKVLSESSKEELLVKQGDPTLVHGFIECIKARRLPYLTVDTSILTENVFKVSVGSHFYRGPEPRIVDVSVVDGATPISISSLAPSTVIGFENAPLEGTFKFEPGRTDAAVQVRTTLGDKIVVVKKCRRGVAGTWTVVGVDSEVHEDPAGTFETMIQVPQASCHPYCGERGNGPGDWVGPYPMQVPADFVIRNAHADCLGACNWDSNKTFITKSEQEIDFKLIVGTIAHQYKLTADKFKHTTVTVDKVLARGELQFGSSVSFTVPADGSIKFDGIFGTPILTSHMLSTGQLGGMSGWLEQEGLPQDTPNGRVYSFKVIDPDCAVQ